MITATLVTAIDFDKRKDVPVQVFSHKEGDTWYVTKAGPGYTNVYKVTEFDVNGLDWLVRHEVNREAKKDEAPPE